MTDIDIQVVRFKALAHPVRLQILALLRQRDEVCVCHMEAAIKKRQAYISQQLMTLRENGIIDSRRDGRMVFYWIADDTVRDLLDAAFGPADRDHRARLPGCSCPDCTTVIITDIELRA